MKKENEKNLREGEGEGGVVRRVGEKEKWKHRRRDKMRLESFKKPKKYLLFYKFYVLMENKYKIYLTKIAYYLLNVKMYLYFKIKFMVIFKKFKY